MEETIIKNFFINKFDEYSRNHIFAIDFYNMTQEDKYNIAKQTFEDIQKYAYTEEVDETTKDNIILAFMELLS